MKDAVATMGAILPDDVAGRDAVHIAVIAARATIALRPGQHVGFYADGDEGAGTVANPIGIVDPYIKESIKAGQRFWLYLYPRTITGLRHHWTHPAFPDDAKDRVYNRPAERLASEEWLRAFIGGADCPSYEVVMGAVAKVADGGSPSRFDDDYLYFQDMDAHGEIPDEFWRHAEVVLGRPISVRPKHFSCAC